MKKQRAIDAIALYEQLSTEVGSMLKQPPGIIVSKIMAMILQAPTIEPKECHWTNIEDGLPEIPGKENEYGRAYVAVAIKGWQRSYPMFYERETVRGKVVCRWKWPWGRLYDANEIAAWTYLPQPPQKQEDATDGTAEPQC